MTFSDGHRRLQWLIVVVQLALLVRGLALLAGPWQDPSRALNPDSRRYVALAHNLKDFQSFSIDPHSEGFTHQSILQLREANGTLEPIDAHGLIPDGVRTPGYPLFVALTEGAGRDLRLTLLAQCVLGALMSGAVMLLAEAFGLTLTGAVIVGVLWALHPALVLQDELIATESLFNACVILALLAAARSRSRSSLAVAGALIGVASIVRPMLGLFFLPAVFVLAWKHLRRDLIAAAIVTTVAVTPLVGWAARNASVGEGFRVSTIGDINLLFYHAAFSISEERGEDWRQSWDARLTELADELGTRLRPGEDVMRAARSLALEKLESRPWAALRVLLKSELKMLVDHSVESAAPVFGRTYVPSGLFSRLVLRDPAAVAGPLNAPVLIVALLWTGLNAAIAILAAGALVVACWRRNWAMVIGCGLPTALFVAATGAVGLERMRMPVMLPLLILAASLSHVVRRDCATVRQRDVAA